MVVTKSTALTEACDCMQYVHRVIGRQSDIPLRKNMDPADKSPTIVVEDTEDSLDELSEYLDVLSSSARLRIVKFLEKKPRDARAISREIETSYENTKKHLDKLMSIGVIKKRRASGPPHPKEFIRSGSIPLSRGAWNPSYGTSGFSPTHGFRSSVGRSHGDWNRSKTRSPRKSSGTFLPSLSLAGMMMAGHSC